MDEFSAKCKQGVHKLQKTKYRVIERIFEHGKAVGYIVISESGEKAELSRKLMKSLLRNKRANVVNATLTRDGRIVLSEEDYRSHQEW